MAQVRDSCFRVMKINEVDVDLIDLHMEHPVTIEIEHEMYSEELIEDINNLERGNIINSKIQSQDILHIDGIWRFLEIEGVESSLLTGIENYTISEEDAQELGYQIMTDGGAYDNFTVDGNTPVTMIANQASSKEWVQLNYLDTYKQISDLIGMDSNPPYEIIHQWDKNKEIIRSYYIGDIETDFAESKK